MWMVFNHSKFARSVHADMATCEGAEGKLREQHRLLHVEGYWLGTNGRLGRLGSFRTDNNVDCLQQRWRMTIALFRPDIAVCS
jgi:hypothetical protein